MSKLRRRSTIYAHVTHIWSYKFKKEIKIQKRRCISSTLSSHPSHALRTGYSIRNKKKTDWRKKNPCVTNRQCNVWYLVIQSRVIYRVPYTPTLYQKTKSIDCLSIDKKVFFCLHVYSVYSHSTNRGAIRRCVLHSYTHWKRLFGCVERRETLSWLTTPQIEKLIHTFPRTYIGLYIHAYIKESWKIEKLYWKWHKEIELSPISSV